MKELINIQSELKAPKNQRNNFGNYNYRSCEDVLEALKPLLAKHECMLNISDTIEYIGERFYVKATATVTNAKGLQISSTAYAREEEQRKAWTVRKLLAVVQATLVNMRLMVCF